MLLIVGVVWTCCEMCDLGIMYFNYMCLYFFPPSWYFPLWNSASCFLVIISQSLAMPKELSMNTRNFQGRSLQCMYWGFFILRSNNNKGSHLIVLLSHYFSTYSLPQLRYLSYCGMSFQVPCCYKSMSCVIIHYVTALYNFWPSLNLWPSEFCFSSVKRRQLLSNEFSSYSHSTAVGTM